MRKIQDMTMTSTENNDCFSIGSLIKVVDCHKTSYKGTVRSFDSNSKILSIEAPSPSVAQLSDIYIFNLDYVADVQILEEKSGQPEPIPFIDVSKISKRLVDQEQKRQQQKNYIGKGVTPEGQRLMNFLSKTISDCAWHECDIVVLGEVTIKPPYGPSNLECSEGSKALTHIRKIVEKHCSEEAKFKQQGKASSS